MKSVAILCSCVSLCLWVNVSTALPAAVDSTQLERLFHKTYNPDTSEAKKKFAPEVLAVSTPCLQKLLVRTDPDVLKLAYEFLDVHDECLKAAGDRTASDAEAKYKTCLESHPQKTTNVKPEDIKVVGDAFEICIARAVSKVKETSPEAATALA